MGTNGKLEHTYILMLENKNNKMKKMKIRLNFSLFKTASF
jgi:hypothetical protein